MPSNIVATPSCAATTMFSSSSSSLLSPEASPDHSAKRLSPSLSPVLSDHQLPTLGSLSHRNSITSATATAPTATASASTARIMSPPIRALRRRSKSVSSFCAMMQHSASLPVLMKPCMSSPVVPVAKPLKPLSDTCSPLNIPADTRSLPSLHPLLSPSVQSSGGAPFMRPRSKSFSVYEDEQAAAAHKGRINARLPAVRTRMAERPAVHLIHDKRSMAEQQPLTESTEEVEDGEDRGEVDGEDEYPTCPVNPALSPIVEVDKEFFSARSP